MTKATAERPLSAQQELFAVEVALHGNQADAYRTAYPKSKLWKPDALWSQASRMAANAKVSARIAALRQKAVAANDLTVERVLREVSRLAFFDISKLYDDAGKLKAIKDIDADTRAAISRIDITPIMANGVLLGTKRTVVTADKNAALDKAMRYLGLNEKDNSQINRAPIDVTVKLVGGKRVAA